MDIFIDLFGSDFKAGSLIILNLILLESLLSIDNAAVLATMVLELPEKDRGKALRYGIMGAYFFRGLCLVFATFLLKVLWLKALGGLYLFWLFINHFMKSLKNKITENEPESTQQSFLYKYTLGLFGKFWATVISIEIMDLAFSLDNVFAAVAFTNKIGLICLGVFIGILAMRFAAQFFVDLMERFPYLEHIAFFIIGILGMKLIFSYLCDIQLCGEAICHALNGHTSDFIFSVSTFLLFVLPLLYSMFKQKFIIKK